MMATRSSKRIKIPSITTLPLSSEELKLLANLTPVQPNTKPCPRGSWSSEEDSILLQAVEDVGEKNVSWEAVAVKVGTHTAKQCRERYFVKLNPDVRRTPFEKWEDEVIQKERQRIGNHWSLIAQLLPGRTSCSVKNRWYTVLRFQQAAPSTVARPLQLPPCSLFPFVPI